MPFEPKLICDDLSHLDDLLHRDDELALPDDLQELAGQLGEDSERLAACYPSSCESIGSHDLSGHATRRTVWLRGPMAAAAAVLLACGAWSATELAHRNASVGNAPEANTSSVPTWDQSTSDSAYDGSASADSFNPDDVVIDNIGLPPSVGALDEGDSFGGGSAAECADFFQDLSAPEQEALLDLLEDESQEVRDLPL